MTLCDSPTRPEHTGRYQMRIALGIARKAHDGQTDKAGKPYVTHPIRVAQAVGTSETLQAAALLHDVIEDTDVTFADLAAEGVSYRVQCIVDTLTRRDDESYDEYIRRVALDKDARAVKMCDLRDNLDPVRCQDYANESLQRRYKRALSYLENAVV